MQARFTMSVAMSRAQNAAFSTADPDIAAKAKRATVDWLGELDSNLRMAQSIRSRRPCCLKKWLAVGDINRVSTALFKVGWL
jgi:hypothetical protein